MSGGRRRTEVPYVWPDTLIRPEGSRLIYLDLLHWVTLAKAATGHAQGADHVLALETLREAVASGEYVIPLCSTHMMELAPTKNQRQRFDVAQVMEDLSGWSVTIPRSSIITLEVEAALDACTHPRKTPYAPVDFLGHGVMRAFGKVGGLLIRDGNDGRDVTAKARETWPDGPDAFDRWKVDAEQQLNRAMLRGPASAAEEASLRADGWDPTIARASAEQRAAGEKALADSFDDIGVHWRTQRVRDTVAVRYMGIDAIADFTKGLAARGVEVEDVYTDPESSRRFTDSMPSADAYVTLLAAAHRDPNTRWTANRMFDLDALSVAVPYHDLVATDREAAHVVVTEGLSDRLGTFVTSSLHDLVAAL
jgi:hypothetical protein